MTKYDALVLELKKAIMTDGHYLLDIVTAAAEQQERIDKTMAKHGFTYEEAIDYEVATPGSARQAVLYKARRARERAGQS